MSERSEKRKEETADLHKEIGDELLARLAPVRIEPARILDLGCGGGDLTRGVAAMYRKAQVIGVDAASAVRQPMGRPRLFRGRPAPLAADITRLPLPAASIDLVVSSLTFQRVGDVAGLFAEIRRVLRPEGALMFSAFGPDTLIELREAWSCVDDEPPLERFADMHDIGDAMLAAGLRDPVMDVDRLRRGAADIDALLRMAESNGAANTVRAGDGRPGGRGLLSALDRAYSARDETGRPLVSWEIVYGHAWGARMPQAGTGDAREFRIPVGAIGRRGTDAGS